MDSRDSRAMFFHHVGELGEEIVGVVGAGGGFRVVLDAEKGKLFVAHTFVGVVVEVDVRNLDVARRQRFGIDAKAVILSGDFDFFGQKILHGMIGAVMAELQLEGFSTESETA